MRTKKFLSLLLSAAMAFSLLTATAFAAAPAEEENGFFDKGYFIRKQTYDDYALFCSELDKLLSNRDVVIKRVE